MYFGIFKISPVRKSALHFRETGLEFLPVKKRFFDKNFLFMFWEFCFSESLRK